MASITTILGTDSLSSSRIVLNDNFQQINDEINTIGTLLNFSTQVLNLKGSVTASELNIPNILSANSSKVTIKKPVLVDTDLTVTGRTVLSFQTDTATSITTVSKSVYSLSLSDAFTVPNGVDGQTVTFISGSAGNVINSDKIAGVTGDIELTPNSTITLTFLNDYWYVISRFDAAV